MNKFFMIVILTIVAFAAVMGGIVMLRVGPPVFKVIVVAGIVAAIWGYVFLIKEIRIKSNENEKSE